MRITLKTVVAASLLLLTVNAGYIWAFASPTILYMGNVLAHLFIGIIFVGSGALLLARDRHSRNGWRVRLTAAAMLAAFTFGAFLVYRGNILELRWALQAHIATALVGVVAALLHLWRPARPRDRAAPLRGSAGGRRGVPRRAAGRDHALGAVPPQPERSHRQSAGAAADGLA